MVKVREKRGRLYLDVYYNGRRTWETLNLMLHGDKKLDAETWRIAEIAAHKRELQIASEQYGLIDPVKSKESLVGFVETLAQGYKASDHMPRCLPYLRQYAGAAQIGAIDERFVQGFKDFLLRTKLSKRTASFYLDALKHALRIAVRDRVIMRNPGEAIKGIGYPQVAKISLTEEEVSRLASTPVDGELGVEVKKAFLFACFTGLRVVDLKTLAWENIRRDPPRLAKVQHKTGTVIWEDLHETAWAQINDKALHKRDERVFPLLEPAGVGTYDCLEKWAKRAKVDTHVTWHTSRRTFAQLLLEHGVDLFTTSRLMGHTKIATTTLYLQGDKLKAAAIAALPELKLSREKA